ncbi:MAG: YqaJ viral recombinase family protein [Defluviitaleaceae bacterium]|nr:YqaJ viral recombinase family protein [Defluviitaleaceae bacterium]
MFKILASTDDLPYADWLELRRTGLGGSDASVVCNINQYKSPIELWMEKTGQYPHQEAGEAAYWGTQLESLVRSEFNKRTGIEVTPVNEILQSEAYPFMLANLDGVCEHPHYGTCIFEAKTTGAFNGGDWEDAIPDVYMLQIQHYMAVTGYKGAYVAVLIGGNTFKWKFIERDDDLISIIIRLESDFWEKVKTGMPPSVDGSDASAKFLKARFPDSVPLSKIDLPDTAADIITQYDSACEKVEQFNEQKQEAENLLKQMLGEHEAGAIRDRVIIWKTVTQERLDSKTLKTEHPTLYKKYASKTSHRRFSIKAAG